jgi:hypothetical protein
MFLVRLSAREYDKELTSGEGPSLKFNTVDLYRVSDAEPKGGHRPPYYSPFLGLRELK